MYLFIIPSRDVTASPEIHANLLPVITSPPLVGCTRPIAVVRYASKRPGLVGARLFRPLGTPRSTRGRTGRQTYVANHPHDSLGTAFRRSRSADPFGRSLPYVVVIV